MTSEGNPNEEASRWLRQFSDALARADAAGAAAMFEADGLWRDLIAFTWNFKTMESRVEIETMLRATLRATRPAGWQLLGDASAKDGVTEAWFRFETQAGSGKGHLRLRDNRCWTLLTTLQALSGFEEKTGAHDSRELGVEHGALKHRLSWLERKNQEEAELGNSRQPYCVIVGGGQGGLGLAARLKQLNVPSIVIDKHARPGDAWRKRYRSLCLHDPVWYDHMPYLPFPDHWPVFSPKDK
jgi:putative flavoprotein involved in K+ transport